MCMATKTMFLGCTANENASYFHTLFQSSSHRFHWVQAEQSAIFGYSEYQPWSISLNCDFLYRGEVAGIDMSVRSFKLSTWTTKDANCVACLTLTLVCAIQWFQSILDVFHWVCICWLVLRGASSWPPRMTSFVNESIRIQKVSWASFCLYATRHCCVRWARTWNTFEFWRRRIETWSALHRQPPSMVDQTWWRRPENKAKLIGVSVYWTKSQLYCALRPLGLLQCTQEWIQLRSCPKKWEGLGARISSI